MRLLGHGLKGLIVGVLVVGVLLLLFGAPRGVNRLGEFLFVALVGGSLGAGLGITIGAARSGPEPARSQPDGPLILSRRRDEDQGPGLSRLDAMLASVYAITATGIATACLVGGMGRRNLLRFAMDLTPFAGLGSAQAKLALLGTFALVFGVALLAVFSRTEPGRAVRWQHRFGLAFSGFASAFAWPVVLFGFVAT